MKVISLLSTAALTTCLTASGFCEEENPKRMDFRESQHEMIISQQTSNGYNNTQDYSSSSKMMNNQDGNRVMDSSHGCVDQGFSLEAEFLWWRASLDNLEYAATLGGTTDGSGPGNFNITGKFKHPGFQFDPGVRVSAGYDFGMSNWDVFGRWTYHYSDPSSSASGGFGIFATREFYVSNNTQTLVLAESARTKWQNQINVADLEMGYDYFFSDRFSFRPSFGLKASWINMENNTSYTNATYEEDQNNAQGVPSTVTVVVPSVSVRNKSDWWGIGPAVGMDGHLHMGWGFSLYGRVSGALMYGNFDSRFKQVDSNGSSIELKSNNDYRQRAMSQLLIGLEWAHCFSNNVLLAFNLGWEGQYWWNQHQMNMIVDSQPSGDLTLTGLDAGIRLDF